jgi:hypothetical protein
MKTSFKKSSRIALVLALVALGVSGLASSVVPAQAAAISKKNTDNSQVVQNLNSFLKPASEGLFPGNANGLTVGVSKRQDVENKLGKPQSPRKDENSFYVYHANMGQPGYAFAYKKDVLSEMRYFGTNVERQTNIGGVTQKLLKQQWGKPTSIKLFKNGKATQTKVSYNRGEYVLEFIFNDATHLDHINLKKKAGK